MNTPSHTCCFFDEFGIPCRYLCAAAIHVNILPKTIVIKQLQVVSLKETNEGSKVPVDLNNLEDDGTKPPRLTRMRGRPKVKRIPSSAENKRDGQLSAESVVCVDITRGRAKEPNQMLTESEPSPPRVVVCYD